jgi:hypothetical protein
MFSNARSKVNKAFPETADSCKSVRQARMIRDEDEQGNNAAGKDFWLVSSGHPIPKIEERKGKERKVCAIRAYTPNTDAGLQQTSSAAK